MTTRVGSQHPTRDRNNSRAVLVTALALSWVFSRASAGEAAARPRQTIVCPRIAMALRDGKVSADAWEKAATFDLVLAVTGGAPEHTTSGRIMCDDEHLYVKVIAVAPEGLTRPQRLARDDRRVTSQHDNLQMFLTPEASPDRYYRLAMDRAGNIWDTAYRRDSGATLGDRWHPMWRLTVTEIPGGWIAEIVVPFAAFEADPPKPGDLWRFKLGRYGEGLPLTMWPFNPTSSFHVPVNDGALYFEAENLLAGGDFDDARLGSAPPRWTVYAAPEEGLGEVKVAADAQAAGGQALFYRKRSVETHLPQVWHRGHPLAPGGAYELSAMIKGDIPNMNLRMDTYVDGQRVRKGRGVRPIARFQRYAFQFVVPQGAAAVNVGFSPGTAIAGQATIDQVVLRRVLGDDLGEARPVVPLVFALDPDPVHGLASLMERAGHKPWERFQCPGGRAVKTYRVMFKDRKYGTGIWMMDRSHTPESDPGASVWPCWNADASTLYLSGGRYLGKELHRGWLFTSNFSQLVPAPAGGRPVWDRADPDVFFTPINVRGSISRHNWRTGESRVLAEWKPHPRERLYGLTRDNRHVFVDVANGGIWVPYVPDPNRPIPLLPLHDGRPTAPDGSILMGGTASTAFAEPWGHLFRIRVGMLIDKETGTSRRIIAPVCGETTYLETFKSGRVQFPRGAQWEGYGIERDWDDVPVPTDLSVDELYALFRSLPWMTHGHQSVSSDGVFYARDGKDTTLWRMREGKKFGEIRVSSNGGNYHLHWQNHPNYLVAWIRGWHGMTRGTFARPENASLIYQGFVDGTWQPVLDTKHRFTPARRCSYEMLSPDATKIHYASTMTGRSKNYVAVLARPRPPADVMWQAPDGRVQLRWRSSMSAREIRGYLVYRSDRSGEDYTLVTPEPVAGLSWVDAAVKPGREYFYVVTSLEHSGGESSFSPEASGAGIDLDEAPRQPVRIYIEPESAIFDLPFSQVQTGLSMGRDRLEASNWFYVYRTPYASEGNAECALDVPQASEYRLWARVRCGRRAGGWEVQVDGGTVGRAETTQSDWTWKPVGDQAVHLARGRHRLAFSTTDAGAHLDLLALSTDPSFVPSGPRPEHRPDPQPPSALRVADVAGRVVHLVWAHEPDGHFSHYNVYSSRQPIATPEQQHLIASPTDRDLVDWGLRAGVEYHYAVTAVNRRGHESAPARTKAATPPAATPLFEAELAFDRGSRKGPFREGSADGLHAQAFLVPLQPAENEVSWRVSVPQEMTAYLWLRYLPGLAKRKSRRVAVYQKVRVALDGKPLTELNLPTALNIPDRYLTKAGNPLAPHFWTWGAPVGHQLEGVAMPAGEHTLTLSRLAAEVRYDVLFVTNEPSFVPQDGRLRQ